MDFFDPQGDPLVTPRALVKRLTRPALGAKGLHVEPCALICVIPPDLRAFVKRLHGEPVKAWWRMREVYRGSLGDKKITIARAPYGAPGCVSLAEELAAFGMRRALFIGYCGSLQPGVRAGDIICPTQAVREEGPSYHYLPADSPAKPHPDIQKLIVESLQRKKIPCHEGTIWTTDAIYQETAGKVARYQTEGVLGVEMELAALFAFGTARKIPVGGILVVADELATGRWRPRFFSPRLLKGVRRARAAAVEILGELG